MILFATIDQTGEVSEVEVRQSVPELERGRDRRDRATAVRAAPWSMEWHVPVSMTMTVNFMLPSR